MDLDDLALFVRIADLGSISAAARALDIPKSSASRALARLEETLGSRLVQRSTRQLALTEEGLLLRTHAARILGAVGEARAALGRASGEVSGLVRISAPYTLGRALAVPVLGRLMAAHPALRVELTFSGARADLISDGVDIALRTGALGDSGLMSRRLLSVRPGLYASADYLERNGSPATPGDLATHALLDVPRPGGLKRWVLRHGRDEHVVEVVPVAVMNDPGALADLARHGAGIAWLPDFVVAHTDARTLRAVLPEWSLAAADIHALFPTHAGLAPKTRIVLDELAAQARQLERAAGGSVDDD